MLMYSPPKLPFKWPLKFVLLIFFFFFFPLEGDVFPIAASSGRLALHGHVSTTSTPADTGGRENLYMCVCVFVFQNSDMSGLVRQFDVKDSVTCSTTTTFFFFLSLSLA